MSSPPSGRLPDGRLVEFLGAPVATPEPDDPIDMIAFNVTVVVDGSEVVVDRQLWDREVIEQARREGQRKAGRG